MKIDQLIEFFRIHQDYAKDIHMLVTNTDTWALVRSMLVELHDVTIHVYSQNRQIIKDILKVLEYELKIQKGNTLEINTLEDLMKQKEIGVLMFDAQTEYQQLIALKEKKPKNVVGFFKGTCVSYLHIWEAYRNSVDYFYLRYQLDNTKEEVFDWKKGEYPVELSVIFPVFKVEKYLKQCIESVTAWKAPYVEYLFVNDGSPDNSRNIILEYAKKDERIKLIDKPNGGCASARQKGLEQAKGRYIGFIDPDDFVEKDMFRQLFGRAMLGKYEVCYCGYNEYYESNGSSKAVADALADPYAWGTINKNDIRKLIIHQRVAIWRGIYSRELINRAKIEFQTNLRRFDDLPFKVEICAHARSVVALPQHLYYYRLDRPGQDVSCNDERLYVHFDIFRHLDKVLGKIDDRKLMDYLQVCKVQTHNYALKKLQPQFVKEYGRQAREDYKQNVGVLRTLMDLKVWLNGSGIAGYLGVMFGKEMIYKKHLK